MKGCLSGAAVIIVSLAVALALYWALSSRFGTSDDGPTGHTITTRSNA